MKKIFFFNIKRDRQRGRQRHIKTDRDRETDRLSERLCVRMRDNTHLFRYESLSLFLSPLIYSTLMNKDDRTHCAAHS